MSPEENPPEDSEMGLDPLDSIEEGSSPSSASDHMVGSSDLAPNRTNEPFEASLVSPDSSDNGSPAEGDAESEIVSAVLADSGQPNDFESLAGSVSAGGQASAALDPNAHLGVAPPPIVDNLDNIAANGGAVGSLVLGIWTLIGSFVTHWSVVNGVIGLLMGFWGLTSRKRGMAWIGLCLCILSIFLCLIRVSEMVQFYLNTANDTGL